MKFRLKKMNTIELRYQCFYLESRFSTTTGLRSLNHHCMSNFIQSAPTNKIDRTDCASYIRK